MILDIFDSTKHWSYSADDQLAESQFSSLEKEARINLPKGFFDRSAPLLLSFARQSRLYQTLKTIPKGVLQNVFFDCCEDSQFYRNHIANDPNVYVTQDFISFRMGTEQEADRYGWISMKKARTMYKNDDDFVKALASITIFTNEELTKITKDVSTTWRLFQKKTSNFSVLIYARHIFLKYVKHVLEKFIRNGYQRVQFRGQLVRLSVYDDKGQFVGKQGQNGFALAFDQAFKQIEKEHPDFSAGFIFCLRKQFSEEEIEKEIQKICEINWVRSVGLDFVEEEDKYGSLERYDKIVERVMAKYPTVRLWKVYHAGETNNHLSRNIEEAVVAGSVRIGHGLNILQRVQFLPFCKHICFEKCPISNLLMGYTGDPRQSSAPILMGLGYAVTVNVGDAGRFGVQDSTGDYFVASVSYDWTLKHFKLLAINSINHALCKQRQRLQILKKFNESWNQWVQKFLDGTHIKQVNNKIRRLDIFTSATHWKFGEKDELAEQKFENLKFKEIAKLPDGFFKKTALTHLEHIRSSKLFEILRDIPKGVLHHDHFDCNEDEQFYRLHVITDPNVYLNAEKTEFRIGTSKQAADEKWVSFAELQEELPNQRQLVKFVSNLTMLSRDELSQISGNQHEFWVVFEKKISNFFIIVFTLHLFKKYTRHVLLKFIKNGYERVEFRALLCQLKEYDEQGNFIKQHDQKMYMTAFDEVYFEVRQKHPNFSAAFIFFGLKFWSEEQNFKVLDKACSYEWQRMVGIDFVQQQDPYGSMQPYIRVGDEIVKKWAHLNLKKVYHAGETKDHLNNNVELSVRAGCVRIGHGLNIVKRIQYLNQCRHICFELNPISNLLTGGMSDLRMSPAPLLLGLGYAVSISSDDPGKFGYQDTTVDYFAAVVSFNWSLRHLKLIAYHSINHALVSEGERIKILANFQQKWSKWVQQFLFYHSKDKIDNEFRLPSHLYEEQHKYSVKLRAPIISQRINSVSDIQ